jgi:hypothetical protein
MLKRARYALQRTRKQHEGCAPPMEAVTKHAERHRL